MAELKVSSFNLAFFQPPRNPLPDETFSEILSMVLLNFPLADQISNPILIARRKEGGQISMAPVFIQFLNFETKDFDSDLKLTKEIADNYFAKYKTEKVHQIGIRFVSSKDASFQDQERQLVKGEHFKLTPDNRKILTPSEDVKVGVRLVFRRDDKRYDVKIEPYFNKIEYNYIDFNVVLQNLDISPNDVYGLVEQESLFFTKEFSKIIE
jgi:hypothetical protein